MLNLATMTNAQLDSKVLRCIRSLLNSNQATTNDAIFRHVFFSKLPHADEVKARAAVDKSLLRMKHQHTIYPATTGAGWILTSKGNKPWQK